VKATLGLRKGQLGFTLTGKDGDYTATPPVALTLTFPATGECVRTDFSGPKQSCSVKSKGKSLVCK
jgi:hypothetical protein